MIVSKLPAVTKYDIAGVAGKKNFSMFSLEKSMMNKEIGFARKMLGIFETKGVSIEHVPSSIDSMSVVVSSEEIGEKTDAILEDLRRVFEPDMLEVEHDLSLIAVVGEGMFHQVGIAAKVFNALGGAGVNIRIIGQGASEFNIIIGVGHSDYETAIRALYAAMMRPNPAFKG